MTKLTSANCKLQLPYSLWNYAVPKFSMVVKYNWMIGLVNLMLL